MSSRRRGRRGGLFRSDDGDDDDVGVACCFQFIHWVLARFFFLIFYSFVAFVLRGQWDTCSYDVWLVMPVTHITIRLATAG